MKQQIVWTALPYGIEGDKARLTVFVAPRLEGDAPTTPLSDFPDFQNWANTVRNISFTAVYANSGVEEKLELVSEPDPALWDRIFTPGVFVRGYEFTDLSKHVLRSYPIRDTLLFLKNTYASWANQGLGSPPSFDDVKNIPDLRIPLDSLHERSRNKIGQYLEEQLQGSKALPPGLNDEENFYQVHAFYNRKEIQNPYYKHPDHDRVPHPPKPHDFDFHEGVAMLADHPSLMRQLGLVLDFEMPLPPKPVDAIRVRPEWQAGFHANEDLTPFTWYIYKGKEFLARWKDEGSDLLDGFLDLRNVEDTFSEPKSPFSLVQVDPDGALLKFMHFAYGMGGYFQKGYPMGMDRDTPLPSLRTGGLGLFRNARAFKIHNGLETILDRNLSLQANNPNVLPGPTPVSDYFWAEELLRGYRVDIDDLTQGGKPLSLCWRKGNYRFKSGDFLPLKPEEGYIKSASASSQEEAPEELFLHEMLFRWNGWSLVAERPNQTIVSETSVEPDPTTGNLVDKQAELVKRPLSQPLGDIDLEPLLQALSGSLPRLRFGHLYRMRVRAVDIAGNSLPMEHTDWDKATLPHTYRRYEPVSSPALVFKKEPTPGEGLERMVIRSNYDKDAIADCERQVVPPKTSQELSETHGEFDDYIGPGKDHLKGYNIALRESGSLKDKEIIDISSGLPVPLPHADQIGEFKIKSATGEETTLVLHGEDCLIVPYLPDPMSAGTAIRDIPRLAPSWLPGLDKVIDPFIKVVKVPFHTQWPEAQSFCLRIAERKGSMPDNSCIEDFGVVDETDQAQWTEDAVSGKRTLTIFLEKAEKVTLRYSSYLPSNPGDPKDLFALWDWFKNKPNAQNFVDAGCFWMLTPSRKLELVHAVQQPLCKPKLLPDVKTVKTNMGQTNAALSGTAGLNAWSTDKIDLLADWEEWDDTRPDGPVRIKKSAHACEGTIDYEKVYEAKLDEVPHALTHEFSDTLHRWVDYHLVATSRFREYFVPEGGNAIDFTRVGDPHKLNVDNSARPAAPKVQYIVPSFGWKTQVKDHVLTRMRIGGGLRVYLDRPWYSSGDDELLGVVMAPVDKSNPQPPDDILIPYVTQCGLDPIWKTALPVTALDRTDFKNYNAHAENLTLEELTPPAETSGTAGESTGSAEFGSIIHDPTIIGHILSPLPPYFMLGKRVNVVGYAPEFNEERKLWFADIQFNPDRLSSYYPFVRLALARFQPYSIPGSDAYLSRVVMTDFIQLVPTRTLQVSYTKKFEDMINVSVVLVGYSPKTEGKPNPVSIEIEEHDENIPGELGWKPWKGVKGQIPMDRVKTHRWLDGMFTADLSYLAVWQIEQDLPEKYLKGNLRLVIKEYERHTADGEIKIGEDGPYLEDIRDLRVVYSDTVMLRELNRD